LCVLTAGGSGTGRGDTETVRIEDFAGRALGTTAAAATGITTYGRPGISRAAGTGVGIAAGALIAGTGSTAGREEFGTQWGKWF
jgi:hypothetical protein